MKSTETSSQSFVESIQEARDQHLLRRNISWSYKSIWCSEP